MHQSCPHCDQPDMSLLRLVLIGEILRAEEPLLVLLADLWHQSGLLPLVEQLPAPPDGARRAHCCTEGASSRTPGTWMTSHRRPRAC